jgi:predicted kinase
VKTDVTNYEKNLTQARSLFRKHYQKPLQAEEYAEIFFSGKVGERVSKFEFDEKSAVVLLGMSCMGKTTFANDFIQKHKEFTLLSFDNFAINLLSSQFFTNTDEKAVQEFGKSLDESLKEGKKVIIDGQYVNVVSRSALFTTLNEAGYTIYVISFINMPGELVDQRIESRAIDNTVSDILYKMPDYNPEPGKKIYGLTIDDYAKYMRINRKKALSYIKSKSSFRSYLAKEHGLRVNELIDSNVIFQIQQDAFIYGCDYYLDLY